MFTEARSLLNAQRSSERLTVAPLFKGTLLGKINKIKVFGQINVLRQIKVYFDIHLNKQSFQVGWCMVFF